MSCSIRAVVLLVTALLSTSWSTASASAATAPREMSEHELLELETRLLGPEHARDHAMSRRYGRRELERRGRKPAATGRKATDPVLSGTASSTSLAGTAAGDPAVEGVWRAPFAMPVVGVHSALLPTGKVMLFSQKVNDYKGEDAAAYLWDPTKAPGEAGEFTAVPPADNIWCGAQSLLADGQLLVTGGNLAYESDTSGWKGLKTVFTFDPWSETWTRQPDMPKGRWYPTQTLMPDGRTLITSGYTDTGSKNLDIDVFNPPASRGGVGSITTVARYGTLANAPDYPRLYPHWFVMPSGGLLNTGYTPGESWLLRFSSTGAAIGEDRPNWLRNRKYGSAVLMPGSPSGSTRVLRTGGYDSLSSQKASVTGSEFYDEATRATPVAGPSLRVPRSHLNTVLLPDGSMVSVGGGHGEQPGTASDENANEELGAAGTEHRAIEILDRGSTTWRLGPSQVHKRAYHSTAILLPDGRVLSAGDDRDVARGSDYNRTDRAEIYEPAYLHKAGTRPSITAAPTSVSYGESFSIGTSSAITSAVLISPGATTHANDMHQRLVPLTTAPAADGSGADLTAPPSANVAPPGYYMLFAVNADGKPSVARWVYVGQSRPDVQFQDDEPPVAAPSPPQQPVSPAPPPAAVPGDQADTTAPRVTVRAASTLRGMRASRRLSLRVRLNEAARVTFTVEMMTPSGRRIGRLPDRGRRVLRFPRGTTRTVSLPLSRTIRRRLPSSRVRMTVRTRARDLSGNTATRNIRLSLTRR